MSSGAYAEAAVFSWIALWVALLVEDGDAGGRSGRGLVLERPWPSRTRRRRGLTRER